jgi:NTE family protein
MCWRRASTSSKCGFRAADSGEPPEVLVAPRLARLRLLDFHRAKEAIDEGRRAVERVAHNLALLNENAP